MRWQSHIVLISLYHCLRAVSATPEGLHNIGAQSFQKGVNDLAGISVRATEDDEDCTGDLTRSLNTNRL